MNKILLVGGVSKDPELNTTSNGKSVCRFSIGVTRRFANTEGERESDFFNIVVWGAMGENCNKYLKKGSKVSIVGRVQTGIYEKDGIKRPTFDIVAEEVEFLSSPKTTNDSAVTNSTPELTPIDSEDDLPF